MSSAARPLRGYQVQAVEAADRGLREWARGQLLMASGTGKTRVTAGVAARLAGPNEVVVVLVPSIALAAQTIAVWPEGCPVGEVFAVCSDRTVGERDGMRASELPVPVSTDPGQIARWLKKASGRVLLVGTYDSAHRLAKALVIAGVTAALTVCDEAHRLAGPADKVSSRILRPGVLPDRYRLFATATPRIGQGPQAVSMDNHDLFGPPLYTYSFASGIADGWLKNYRLVIAAVTSSQIAEMLGNGGDVIVSEGGVPLRLAVAQAALAMCAREFGLRRCLAFTARVSQARDFAITFSSTLQMLPPDRRPAGTLSAGWVHGGMTSLQRDLVLDRLRRPPAGGWSVVANARCLTEGVDVPEADSVLYCSPKTSVIDIVQACGRALRRHEDADTATIIVPALINDPGENGAVDSEATPYRHVLRVVSALAAHDEALATALGAARARRDDSGGDAPRLPGQITVLAPPGTVREVIDSLKLRIIDGPAPTWDEGYRHAAAYHAAHGHLDVPYGYVCEDGFLLDRWLSGQRAVRNAVRLRQQRVRQLDAIGMIWDLDDHRWRTHFREVVSFRQEHGHLRIPQDYRPSSKIRLAAWLSRQLAKWRDGALLPAHADLLRQIGLDSPDARWARELGKLVDAITRHGGQKRLPAGSDEARWLDHESVKYQRGTLSDEKARLFRDAGIALSRDDLWHLTFGAVTQFHATNGHWKIPAGLLTPQGISMSQWSKYQRRAREKGAINPDYEKLLDRAGFPWDPRDRDWQARYREAAAFKEEHGHLSVPASTQLGNWLYQQIRAWEAGTLSAARATLLRVLGLIGDPADTPLAAHRPVLPSP